MPQNDPFGPKLAFLVNLGQAMQAYSMPVVGRLVVVVRGLYLARYLFTLYNTRLLFEHIFCFVLYQGPTACPVSSPKMPSVSTSKPLKILLGYVN